MRRRVLLAVLPVLAAVALAVAISGNITHSGSGTTRGRPVLAGHGVKVSIASMQAHQERVDRHKGTGPITEIREKPDPVEQAAAGAERAAGETAGSGESKVGEKPAPGEPEMRPKEQAPSARQLRTGRAALGPVSSFSENTSFLGVQRNESGFIPPDSMGAVGPDQVVVDVNGRIKVFDKQGNLMALDVTDDTFWDAVRNGSEPTDPGVEFDRLTGRWIISAVNTADQNNRVMIAVSSGPDINNLSSFTFFSFDQNTPIPANNGQFADYPQLGVDSQAVYIGVNGFSGNSFGGSSVYVIKKSTLLAGGPLQVTGFRVANPGGAGPSSPQPATDMDSTVSDGYIVGADNLDLSTLDVRRITDPGGTPSISGNLQVSGVTATSLPLNVPANGTHNTLDALDDRLFEAMVARGPDGTDSLWTAHNISVNASGVATGIRNRDADRWYQIGDLSGTPTVTPPTGQSGTLFDTATSTPPQFFWMPSIAMNGQGHASLNSSSAGPGRFAEVVSSGRLTTDPPGATESPDTVQSSTNPYDVNPSSGFAANKRWGDYSQTVVDPNDNQTFWTFQEYANATDSWGVRVIQLKAPPPATPSVATPSTVDSGSCSEQVDVTGTSSGGSGFFDPGPGFSNHITASVTGGVVVRGVTYTDPTHLTLNLDTTGASSGAQDVTVTNPDGQSDTATGLVTVGSPVSGPITPCPSGTVPASPKNDNNPTVVGVADPGSTVDVYTDPSCTGTPVGTDSAANFASPGIAVDPVADDSNTSYYVSSTDGITPSPCSSTLPGTSGFVTYVEDSTPPVPSVNLGPNGPTNDDTPRFAFSATDSVGPVTFECSIDTGTPSFGPCSGPGNSDTSSPLSEGGPYTFRVRATDAAGNAATATRTFTVDVTPPTVQILSGPTGTTTDPRPTFTFTGNDPPLGTPTFECSIDTGSADFGSCSGPGNRDTPSGALANGSYAFHVQATDTAGNTATATRLFAVNVPGPPPPPSPASPPDTTITKAPKKKTTKRRPKFKFSSSQAGSSFQCRLDKGQFAACASPFKPPKLRLGKHVLRVRAIGPTGVADPAPAVKKFKVIA
ncbi:MAG TPA: Ig-like domain repeat protein [Solirubrobacterales bacterium]|nr:Ig-like domain repeat protein [Solirubrobacterales bacterium]